MILRQIKATLHKKYEEYFYRGKCLCCADKLFEHFDGVSPGIHGEYPKTIWLTAHDRPAANRLKITSWKLMDCDDWQYCLVDENCTIEILVTQAEQIIKRFMKGNTVFYLEVHYEE